MGESAMYRDERIKIGTGGDMLYLRADQASLVEALPESVDPIKDAGSIRFRFPFPNEDHLEPGQFEDSDRDIPVRDVQPPAGLDHHPVQFSSSRGFLVSLPCPESGVDIGFKVHRNGYSGAVRLVQQRLWEGRLVAVCECGGCRARYRLPTLADAQPLIDALLRMAAGRPDAGDWWRAIAKRVRAGYDDGAARALGFI
jgi:hypothetical protein